MFASVGITKRTAGLVFRRTVGSRVQLPTLIWLESRRFYTAFSGREIRRAGDDLILDCVDESGNGSQVNLHPDWLRDCCSCHLCINSDTKQRNFKLSEVPINPRVASFESSGASFNVKWDDGHQSNYNWAWISSMNPAAKGETRFNSPRRIWTGQMARHVPQVHFEDVMASSHDTGMATLLETIHSWGFCFVENTPVTPQATKQLLESIGPIRKTHYGGFYDFQPDLSKADTAYTNLALPLHTDTTYFTEPAGLQAFHILSHKPGTESSKLPSVAEVEETDVDLGGSSVLADGFNAAHELLLEAPGDFHVLSNVSVPWHCSGNEDVAIAPDRPYPVIEARGGQYHRIRWNNSDRGYLAPDETTARWFRAARKWEAILERASSQFWFKLEPGRVLIFDNWRILHGRSSFEGWRRMCGGYINRDDFVSRWSLTNRARQQVIWENMRLR